MSERKLFPDSVVQLPADGAHAPLGLNVQAAEASRLSEPMTLHFAFGISADAQADLESRVAKGEVIPAAEQAQKYEPPAGDVTALQSWLKAQGFTITHVARDGVYAEAPAGQVAKSLSVDVVRVTRDGLTHNAARNAPSLPADIARNVRSIDGLQPFLRAHRHSRQRTPKATDRSAAAKRTPPGTNHHKVAPPYLVPEILKAYNAQELGLTGAGQTIAILIDTVPEDADLQAFWKANGIEVDLQRIEKINVTGVALSPPQGEETLDVEWSSGVAPGARIRIYATGSLAFVDLDRALDQIIEDLPTQPGLRQLSISLGLGETYLGGPKGEVATQHQKFLQLAASGVNVFVSSGDAGSNPDETGHGSSGPTQAEYASSDPFVVGVGGTTLVLDTSGALTSETGWVSSGGGKSRFFKRPVWQVAPGLEHQTKRQVPDVSLAADPDDGAFLVLNGKVVQIGGTSWSAPVWAGFCALINEARTRAGQPPLPFLNTLLYPLIGTDAFRDITRGANGQFEAHPGYDLVTGLGVPNVKALVSALAPTSTPAAR
jgi:kumamolisin